jgi:hypothetical protein
VVVRDANADAVASYALTAVIVDGAADAGNVALSSGVAEAARLEAADVDTFSIDALAGESLRIELSETESAFAFTPGVFVYGPDGARIDAVEAARDGVVLEGLEAAADGRYLLVVRDAGADGVGDYSLRVDRSP